MLVVGTVIKSGQPPTVATLLKVGADITIQDHNGFSVIEWIVEKHESESNKTILDAVLEKNKNKKNSDINRKPRKLPLLYSAIVRGQTDYIVQRLIEAGIDLTAKIGGFQPTNVADWVESRSHCRAQKIISDLLAQHGVRPTPRPAS
jgi:16S rRNA U1498 N3-methylase RsmE